MKAIRPTSLLIGVLCSAAAIAQVESSNISLHPPVTEHNMTKAEQIKQLKPATNYIELMQLLRVIHEQGLLIDLAFIEDDNIHRLFGSGEIRSSLFRAGVGYTDIRKELFASANNPLKFRIVIHGLVANVRSGSIYIDNRDLTNALPFRYDLIETFLLPGVTGYDPYDPTKGMTNEFRDFVESLPLATHPKGYWNYWDSKTNLGYRKHRAIVELSRNADILTIDLEQDEE